MVVEVIQPLTKASNAERVGNGIIVPEAVVLTEP
jgi:hypothetical protein